MREAGQGKEQEQRGKWLSRARPHYLTLSLSLQHSLTWLVPLDPSTRGHGDVKEAETIRDLTIIDSDGQRYSALTQAALTQASSQSLKQDKWRRYGQHQYYSW